MSIADLHAHIIVIKPDEKTLPARLNFDIITSLIKLQPNVFAPPPVYDGRKNMFAARKLPFPNDPESGEVRPFSFAFRNTETNIAASST